MIRCGGSALPPSCQRCSAVDPFVWSPGSGQWCRESHLLCYQIRPSFYSLPVRSGLPSVNCLAVRSVAVEAWKCLEPMGNASPDPLTSIFGLNHQGWRTRTLKASNQSPCVHGHKFNDSGLELARQVKGCFLNWSREEGGNINSWGMPILNKAILARMWPIYSILIFTPTFYFIDRIILGPSWHDWYVDFLLPRVLYCFRWINDKCTDTFKIYSK